MKLISYHCLICASDKSENEILLLKIDFKENPRRIEKTVDDWYTGIRIVCKECVQGLIGLFKGES